ncbi:MAG: integration host factor, partial [uncultured Nocardioidaceae bacterium]
GSASAHPRTATGEPREGSGLAAGAGRGEEPAEALGGLDHRRPGPGTDQRGHRQDARDRPAAVDAGAGQGARPPAHGAAGHLGEPSGARPRNEPGRCAATGVRQPQFRPRGGV